VFGGPIAAIGLPGLILASSDLPDLVAMAAEIDLTHPRRLTSEKVSAQLCRSKGSPGQSRGFKDSSSLRVAPLNGATLSKAKIDTLSSKKYRSSSKKKFKPPLHFECKLSFGFEGASQAGERAPEYSLGRASDRKKYETVRRMPWKTGIRCPFP
jgi:hypothetical protein